MAEEHIPASNIAPFALRLQPDLRARLQTAAAENRRSMNAEIEARLDGSANIAPNDLRDWLAGQVAGSVLVSATGGQVAAEIVAHGAYLIADAMLAERAKGGAS